MIRVRARWLLLVVVVGCSHPAPTQRSEEPAPRAHADAGVTIRDAAEASGLVGDAPTGSAANNARRKPIDGKVIERHIDGADLRFAIGVTRVKDGYITREWTGVFLRDGHPIPRTEFKLQRIQPRVVHAKISGHKLPSESVRLYEPDYPDSLK